MTPQQRVQVAFSEFLVAWMTDKENLQPTKDEVRNLGMAFFGGFMVGAKLAVGADAEPLVDAAFKMANDFAAGKNVVRVEVLVREEESDPSGN